MQMVSSVYIVDDHPLYCDGLTALISRESGLNPCGVAHTASKAREEIPSLRPDLVLLDLGLSDGSGLDLIQYFRSVMPGLKMLAVSAFDETIYAERALHSGASGYMMKSEGASNLIEAIHTVLNGDLYVSEVIRQRVFERQLGLRRDEGKVDGLTDRELEVYRMVGEGISTVAIAERLHLSPKTVDSYRRNAQDKLGLRSARELLRHATVWRLEQTS